MREGAREGTGSHLEVRYEIYMYKQIYKISQCTVVAQ